MYERNFDLDLSTSNGRFSLDLNTGTLAASGDHISNDLAEVLSNTTDHALQCSDGSPVPFDGSFKNRVLKLTIHEIDGVDIADISLPPQRISTVAYSHESLKAHSVQDGSITNDKITSGIDASKLTGALPAIDGSALTGIAASSLSADSISDTELANNAVDTSALQNNSVTDQKILSVGIGKLISGVSAYFTYQPSGAECTDNQVLKWTSSNRWECADDLNTGTTSLSAMTGTSDDIAEGSTNLYLSSSERSKLDGIAIGAEINVNADWAASGTDAEILNKPTIPTSISDLTVGSDTISGDALDGGTFSNFTSTGIDDDSTATVLTIDSAGLIGVGTTTPEEALDVVGRVQGDQLCINGDCRASWPSSSYGTGNSGFVGSLTYPTAANCIWSSSSATLSDMSADTDCDTPIITGNATAPTTKVPGIEIPSLPAGRYQVLITGTYFSAESGATSCQFSLSDGTDNSEVIYLEASRGASQLIGHFEYSSPQSNLILQVQASDPGAIGPCRIYGDNGNGADFSFSVSVHRIDGNTNAISIRDDDGNTRIHTEESSNEDTLRFDTDGLERMIISSTGNVGIGVSSPSEPLEVSGNVRATSFEGDGSALTGISTTSIDNGSITLDKVDFASANGLEIPQLSAPPGSPIAGQVYFNTSSNKTMVYNGSSWIEVGAAATSTSSLDAADGSPVAAVVVDNDGNVGIGTSSPGGILDLVSTTGAFIPPRMSTAERNALVSPINGSVIYNTSTNKMNFRENGSWIELSSGGGTGDNSPDAFDFVDLTDQPFSNLFSTSILQITGLTAVSTTSISGDGSPEYRICLDSACTLQIAGWTSTNNSIQNNQYLQLRMNSSANDTTVHTATINVGSGSADWSVTTNDSTPDSFDFTDEFNLSLGDSDRSDIVQITGITGSVPVSVSGEGSPKFRVCSDASCSTPLTSMNSSNKSIENNQYVQMEMNVSNTSLQGQTAALTVGKGSADWATYGELGGAPGCPTLGTQCDDGSYFVISPDIFTADDQQSHDWFHSTADVDTGADSSVDGAANQAWIVANANLAHYPAFQYCENLNMHGHTDWFLPAIDQLTPLYSLKGALGMNISSQYWSSTEYSDGDAYSVWFSLPLGANTWHKHGSNGTRCIRKQSGLAQILNFSDLVDADKNTTYESNTISIVGISDGTNVVLTGEASGEFRVNGGSWVTSGTVNNLDILQIRMTSSSSFSTATNLTVTIGPDSDTWSITTAAGPPFLSGAYWFYGGSGESCDTVCSSRGGTNSATSSYTGASATNCQAVADALGLPGSTAIDFNCSAGGIGGVGCAIASGNRLRCTLPAEDSSIGHAAILRVCGCNNSD